MYPQPLYLMSEKLLSVCSEKSLKVAVAESCTGGLIGGVITSVPGSSVIFDRGFILYTNQAKGEMLDVPAHIFMMHGAISEECARAMAEGVLLKSKAQIGISATGIAGPGGATDDKPVGLVHLACARTGFETLHERHVFDGDRQAVRMEAVECALKMLNFSAALSS